MSALPLSRTGTGRRHSQNPSHGAHQLSAFLHLLPWAVRRGLEPGAGWAAAGDLPQPLRGLSSPGILSCLCVTWSPMHSGKDGKK